MSTPIYNSIRALVDKHGGNEALASELCDVVGDEMPAAAQDALSGYREDPPPSRVGHTELEASLRWCPFAREVTPVGKGAKDAALGNRFIDRNGSEYANPAGCACTASYCLSWRWIDALRGYCGLAGRPTYQPIGEPRRLESRTPLERPTSSEQVDLFDDEAAR